VSATREHRRGAVIAVDGPAGAGKSTAARALAGALGYAYFDSGALYRAVGLAARERGVDVGNADALVAMVDRLTIVIVDGPDGVRVTLDGDDVSAAIREPAAGEWASRVAAVPAVRARLIARQRAVAAQGGVVMDGRDIGTVVLPDADCKFYLDAGVAERARRRHVETPAESVGAIRAAIEARDRRDRERPVAPLRPAPEAIVVDTTALTPEEVLQRLLQVVRARASS
jgi:CMP/dCMP kinase